MFCLPPKKIKNYGTAIRRDLTSLLYERFWIENLHQILMRAKGHFEAILGNSYIILYQNEKDWL